MTTMFRQMTTAGLLALGMGQMLANPTGGNVTSGAATISSSGKVLTVNQSSNIAIINWQTFSIATGETTTFVQPSAASAVLNRVMSGVSTINGTLNANGQVYLINGNGIYIGSGAQINTNTFVASTRDIADADFLAGNMQFTGSSSGTVQNVGTINALGGDVYLIGKTVSNSGTITAPDGTVGLAAGDSVLLNLGGQEHVFVSPTGTATSDTKATAVANSGTITAAQAELAAANGNMYALAINNSGTIRATQVCQKGGRVYLTTDTGMVQNSGTITATQCNNGGTVAFKGGSVWNQSPGKINVSGQSGGTVTVNSQNVQNDGTINAQGSCGCGGTVDFTYAGNALGSVSGLINVDGMGMGGTIDITGTGLNSEAYLSLNLQANSTCGAGGTIDIDAPTIYLTGATLTANGSHTAGDIYIGTGGPSSTLPTAQITDVSVGTTLTADALHNGNGGTIDVAATEISEFMGTATANGSGGGSAGSINISGPTPPTSTVKLNIVGRYAKAIGVETADASGSSSSSSGGGGFQFTDPDQGSGNAFGRPFVGLFNLPTNTTLITAPGDSFGGEDAGAVYLFSDNNGALISTLRGNHPGDAFGSDVDLLAGNAFAILDPAWNNNTGAVAFGSDTTGFANGGGFVSSSNSLIGAATGDEIGSGGLTELFNGSYLVLSPHFNGNAGAVTWVDPSLGKTGVIGEGNSLVGANPNDQIGSGGIVQLNDGQNFLVLSPSFDNGAGAISNGSETAGIVGMVGASNSLVGANADDGVGSSGSITQTPFGYYLVTTSNFDGGAGAVTWSSDSAQTTGMVSANNSLVGTSGGEGGDQVGSGGITLLYNTHNYVVNSPYWNDGTGAVTFGNGSTGVTGVVSSSNSLTGASGGDNAGSGGIQVLYNDNYLVLSPNWSGGAGAVTLQGGSNGTTGVIGSTNSLVGSSESDNVGSGGISVLDNGDYVVLSPYWNDGAGAVTWGNATTGAKGVVSGSNSLVGASEDDNVGSGGIFLLSNGNNYLVLSPNFNGGAGAVTNASNSSAITGTVGSGNSLVGVYSGDSVGSYGSIVDSFDNYYLVVTANFDQGAGAVTWNSDSAGTKGAISAGNSLIGANGGESADQIGSGGITILYNGNYVVDSPNWFLNTGAVTWGSATEGVTGTVGSSNSLTGANFGDSVGGGGIRQLNNASNYLVLSPNFNSGAGAVTNLSSTSATSGVVGSGNSLVGSSSSDGVGSEGSIVDTFQGYYLVLTPNWNGGAGAVTWNSESSGATGAISSSNSLIGSSSSDNVGSGGVTLLFNGNYVVNSPNWNSSTGAVTFGTKDAGVTGEINSENSLVGASEGDSIGSGGIQTLGDNNFLVLSPLFNHSAGAVTWVNGTTGLTGTVGNSNSLVGANEDDSIGSGGIALLGSGNYVVLSPDFNSDAGAVTWGSETSGVSGVVSSLNSLVGESSGDKVGSGGVLELSNGENYLVLSPHWNSGAGAITDASESSAVTGVVGGTNSLVGASAGDGVGTAGSVIDSDDGYFLVRTLSFDSGAGAVTWSSDSSPTVGVVSSSNSLVGTSSGEEVGDGGIAFLQDNNYLVLTPNYGGGAGAVTWGSATAGVSGDVSSSNSLVGASSNDHIGSGGLIFLSNGNYLVQSPLFNGSAGAVTWGSQASGVSGVVSSSNSVTGGGPDSGEEYAGESADGTIYLVAFTTDISQGGDGRVLAGSINGPNSTIPVGPQPDYFTDPLIDSVVASELTNQNNLSVGYYISNPSAQPLDPVSVDSVSGGAVNDGDSHNLAGGSSTSNAPGTHRLVTPGNGIWNIFGGIVHSAPPPAFVAQQLQLSLSPQVLAHLHEILFGTP
jgi:filamentous hemagglutinin family protein